MNWSADTLILVISARDMHRKERKLMKKIKPTPELKSEAEERAFWEKHDSTDYIDWRKVQKASLPKLKLSTKTISLKVDG